MQTDYDWLYHLQLILNKIQTSIFSSLVLKLPIMSVLMMQNECIFGIHFIPPTHAYEPVSLFLLSDQTSVLCFSVDSIIFNITNIKWNLMPHEISLLIFPCT